MRAGREGARHRPDLQGGRSGAQTRAQNHSPAAVGSPRAIDDEDDTLTVSNGEMKDLEAHGTNLDAIMAMQMVEDDDDEIDVSRD